jgi:hypothetical protein
MNHQLIKTWILTDEPLHPEQAKALQAHLATCNSCQSLASAWTEVRAILNSEPLAQPAKGLAERWQARFVAQNQDLALRKQRQSWWFFIIAAGLAVLFFLLLFTQIIASFDSPVEVFMSGMYMVTGAIASLSTLQDLLTTLLNTMIIIVPPVGWVLLTGAMCSLIIIWLVSLRLVIYPRRISQ